MTHYEQHKEHYKTMARDRYYKKREQILKSIHNHYILNRDDMITKARKNYNENKEFRNKMAKQRMYSNVKYLLANNCRTRVRIALKGKYKSDKTFILIGCTPIELKNYLEKLFQPGMTWDNMGKWHVDHIIPCAIFDLSDPIEQKQCFHYSNLQPLWKIDNLRKGTKVGLNYLRSN